MLKLSIILRNEFNFRIKDDQPITESERVEISVKDNLYSLKIPNCIEKIDSGLYMLELKNDFGKSETKSNVTILSNARLYLKQI